MYSCCLSLTSVQDGAGGQRHAPVALPPGTKRYPLYRRLSWPQGRSGWRRNILLPPVFAPRTVQPVASRYTYWTIPTHSFPQPLLNLFHSHSNKSTNQMHQSQIYCSSFKYSSTCFGHPLAHHQELITAVAASGLPLERGFSSVVGRATATFQR
jgi:hypothetical protein